MKRLKRMKRQSEIFETLLNSEYKKFENFLRREAWKTYLNKITA